MSPKKNAAEPKAKGQGKGKAVKTKAKSASANIAPLLDAENANLLASTGQVVKFLKGGGESAKSKISPDQNLILDGSFLRSARGAVQLGPLRVLPGGL